MTFVARGADGQQKPYNVPAGTLVFPSVLALHDFHVGPANDLQSFKPRRWLDSSGNGEKPPQLLGFGFGLKLCVAAKLGESMAKMVAARILQRFALSKPVGAQYAVLDRFVATPGAMPAALTSRDGGY